MRHSIFAMEVCLRLEPGNTLPSTLRNLVVNHPRAATSGDKWWLYRTAADTLLASLHLIEKGCWDYFDDNDRALRDYKMWCDGMITEEGARNGPSWEGGRDPYRSYGTRYLTFTMAFLLAQGTTTDRELAMRCNIPQQNLWRRDVFRYLIEGIPLINFAWVKSNVVYVIPGDERWALTPEDLAQPKFHYLRPLV